MIQILSKKRSALDFERNFGYFELERRIIIMLSNDKLTNLQSRILKSLLSDLRMNRKEIREIINLIHEMFIRTCNTELFVYRRD